MDEGNGNADDFFNDPTPSDNKPIEKIDIESQIPKGILPDTGKAKKVTKPVIDDKNKKPVPVKPKTNDY